jgi:hypothetical protein
MTGSLYIFMALLSVILFHFFVGRIIATHTLFGRNFASSGLFNILSSLGLFLLVVLISLNFDLPLNIIWWIFVGVGFCLFIIFQSSRHEKLPVEHSLTVPFMGLLCLLPSFYFVWGDVPLKVEELAVQLPFINALWVSDFSIMEAPQNNLITGLLLYPLGFLFEEIQPVFALFNIILLVFVTDSLLKITDIQVKWSNLPLVVVGGLLSVTLLNPFFEVDKIAAFNEDLLLAAILLACAMPLCREKPLPFGFGALPIGLVLGVVALGFGEVGLYSSTILGFLYILRSIFDDKTWLEYIFGLIFIICLPLLMYFLYVGHWGYFYESDNYTSLSSQPMELLWLAVLCFVFLTQMFSLKGKGTQTIKQFLVTHAWVTMPVLFSIAYIGCYFLKGGAFSLSHLQFIALIPIWYLVTSWYENSKWRTFAYESPWALALGIAVVFISAQSWVSGILTERYNDPSQHVLQISQELYNEGVTKKDSIAVLEHGKVQGLNYYSALLEYGLKAHEAPVVNVDTLFTKSAQDIRLFHMNLMRNNFKFLWLHTPKAEDKKWVGRFLKMDRSYLFKITPDGLRLVQIYPHPSYTILDVD